MSILWPIQIFVIAALVYILGFEFIVTMIVMAIPRNSPHTVAYAFSDNQSSEWAPPPPWIVQNYGQQWRSVANGPCEK